MLCCENEQFFFSPQIQRRTNNERETRASILHEIKDRQTHMVCKRTQQAPAYKHQPETSHKHTHDIPLLSPPASTPRTSISHKRQIAAAKHTASHARPHKTLAILPPVFRTAYNAKNKAKNMQAPLPLVSRKLHIAVYHILVTLYTQKIRSSRKNKLTERLLPLPLDHNSSKYSPCKPTCTPPPPTHPLQTDYPTAAPGSSSPRLRLRERTLFRRPLLMIPFLPLLLAQPFCRAGLQPVHAIPDNTCETEK